VLPKLRAADDGEAQIADKLTIETKALAKLKVEKAAVEV
jgi:hypothetical protein